MKASEIKKSMHEISQLKASLIEIDKILDAAKQKKRDVKYTELLCKLSSFEIENRIKFLELQCSNSEILNKLKNNNKQSK
jgi:hypothetical protein